MKTYQKMNSNPFREWLVGQTAPVNEDGSEGLLPARLRQMEGGCGSTERVVLVPPGLSGCENIGWSLTPPHKQPPGTETG